VIFRRQFTLGVVCEGHRQDTPCSTLSSPLLPLHRLSPLLPVASALFCRFLHRHKTQLFCFQAIPHSLPKTTGGGGRWNPSLSGSPSTLALSPLTATLMNVPASVANKRLTARLNPLAATLTKKQGAPIPPSSSFLTDLRARGGSLGRTRRPRSRWPRPSRRKGALRRRR
jgi:hypothetical protein